MNLADKPAVAREFQVKAVIPSIYNSIAARSLDRVFKQWEILQVALIINVQ